MANKPTSARRVGSGLGLCLAALSVGMALTASACTVPVFRYGLDHWDPDVFELHVPGSVLGASDTAEWLAPLQNQLSANLVIREDERSDENTDARLLPPGGEPFVLWSGALGPGTLEELVDSPARSKLLKHILAGESVVWLLVDGEDAAQNEQAAGRLQKRLDYLKEVAAIPPQDPFDPESRLGPGPELRVGFRLIRVSRDDPREQVFIRLLAGPHAEALLSASVPFVAPVFGRGRVLGAWPATEMEDADVDEACLFLLGACSCQVKRQNPGWDLLLSVNWPEALFRSEAARSAGPGGSVSPGAAGEKDVSPDPAPAATPETVRFGPTTPALDQTASITQSAGAAKPGFMLMGVAVLSLLFLVLTFRWFGP